MEYGLDESLRVIMSCRRKISRVVHVFIVMRVLVADGRNLATTKFGYVNIDSSSWTPLATHTNENIGECSYLCSKTYNCKAFAYDYVSKTCELGPQPNLPADVDPNGKLILSYKAPNDCRSTQAISEGYQLINNKYYKLGPSKTNHATAVANCGSAGARLAIFDKREDYEAILNLVSSSAWYWVGAFVAADKGTTHCDSSNGPDDCKGFFKWDDVSPITWTSEDIQNWSPGFLRNYAFPDSFCTILKNGNLDDAACSGWAFAYPICQIDCHLTDV